MFDDIRQRVSILPVGVDVGSQSISPDGRWLLMTATAAGQQNLYVYSLDELAREPAVARQLTSTAGPKADAQFTPDSREVFYLEQGRISVIPIETRQSRNISVTAEMDVDFAQEKMEVFRQAWTYMRDGFYDDKFHGVDWNAVRTRYEPRIAGAQTPDEMRRLLNLMVGELNASHMGVAGGGGRGGRGGGGPAAGRLGLRFDRGEYERNGRLRVSERHSAWSGRDYQTSLSWRLRRRGQWFRDYRRRSTWTSFCHTPTTAGPSCPWRHRLTPRIDERSSCGRSPVERRRTCSIANGSSGTART